jgi:hypothetical protein
MSWNVLAANQQESTSCAVESLLVENLTTDGPFRVQLVLGST